MSYKHITINERCCIVEYLNLGWSLSKIAKELGTNKWTISREIKRNNLNGKYSAHIAQESYEKRRMKCRPCGKIADASIVDYVQEKLSAHWSPEQISEQIKIDLINKKISFSSIYNWIYKRLLERPKEIKKREEIGHWELDTVVYSRGKSKACLSTFVERKTRLTKIKLIPNRKANTFNEYCIKAFNSFNNTTVKTLTVDRGKEFAVYLDLESTLKVNVYFADPYSS